VASGVGNAEGNGAGAGIGGVSAGPASSGVATAARTPAVRATVFGAGAYSPGTAIVRSAPAPRAAALSTGMPARTTVAVPARVHVSPRVNQGTVVASSGPQFASGATAAVVASDSGAAVDAQTFPVYTPQLQPQPLASFTPDTATMGAAPDGWVILPPRPRSSP
jgi:hypothetical protein